jgi:hypothetical protein
MVALPEGTVTFLFTDIEGSTARWEHHPTAMAIALARHDALLHAAVERHGGHVVKTTGDGLHAVFAAAGDAVAAVLAAQRLTGDPVALVPGQRLVTFVASTCAGPTSPEHGGNPVRYTALRSTPPTGCSGLRPRHDIGDVAVQ